jgi:hypothetical protein
MIYREQLYTLHNTTRQFGMKISSLKSKVMEFKGKVPNRSEIVTDNTLLEHVNISHIWGVKFHTKRKMMSL